MASKLEKHQQFILDKLAGRFSFKAIAASLSELDCKVDPSTIHTWAKNRAKKLVERQALVNPVAALAPAPQPHAELAAASIPSGPKVSQAIEPSFRSRSASVTPPPKTDNEKDFDRYSLVASESSLQWRK